MTDVKNDTYSARGRANDREAEGYFGFLHIRCEKCERERSFCARVPVRGNRCQCGHVTELGDLRRARTRCKCGASHSYRTNITDDVITISCINCGGPTDLEYNYRKRRYETME